MNITKFFSKRSAYEPMLFVGAAFLAGRSRFIQYFPESSAWGLVSSVGITSLGCVVHDRRNKKPYPDVIQKAAMIGFASIWSTIIVKSLHGRISFKDLGKIVIPGSILMLLRESVLLEEELQEERNKTNALDLKLQQMIVTVSPDNSDGFSVLHGTPPDSGSDKSV